METGSTRHKPVDATPSLAERTSKGVKKGAKIGGMVLGAVVLGSIGLVFVVATSPLWGGYLAGKKISQQRANKNNRMVEVAGSTLGGRKAG